MKATAISLASQTFAENPYMFYEQLRSTHPVTWNNTFRYPGWYVTGYEEAKIILKDARFKNRIPLPQSSKKYERLKNVQNDMMLFQNNMNHQRLRGIVSKVFTPKAAASCRPLIQETAADLLNQVKQQKHMDIISDFAFPLPSLVIANILGVPTEDRSLFKEWTKPLIESIDFTRSKNVLTNGNETTKHVLDYFQDMIQHRKRRPKDDLISMLINEEQDGEKLTDNELLATCILLMAAGHETTVNLISNTILCFLQHPFQRTKLMENPALLETAVEESLRLESPTQMIARVASEDIEISGSHIQSGEHVYILLGAVNRDPRVFENPDAFDITRHPNPHLAFGYGSHFCLGAPLARLEAQIAVKSLLATFPDLRLETENVRWRKLAGFRSLQDLPVIWNKIENHTARKQ